VAVVHRIFIVSSLACALVYAAWEAREYTRTGEDLGLMRAGLALVAAVAIAVYLRGLRHLRAKLTPPPGPDSSAP
jgi:hypothetical protein